MSRFIQIDGRLCLFEKSKRMYTKILKILTEEDVGWDSCSIAR